ncbi:MAG: hypothetical protein ACI8ZM_003496 [Crocinitomix sp.]|jgi:hypothetical protein
MKKVILSASIFCLALGTSFGQTNTNLGFHAGNAGTSNSAFGYEALDIVDGSYNSAFGVGSMKRTTTGENNSAFGYVSLWNNSTGYNNVAMGCRALFRNSTGFRNTASGYEASRYNTSGNHNSSYGFYSLRDNTIGVQNTASGVNSLKYNTIGNYNTASGGAALYKNINGNENTAFGYNASFSNTTASQNSAFGNQALSATTNGGFNTAIGSKSMLSEMGFCNTAIGYYSGPIIDDLYNTTAVGCGAWPSANNSVRIGNAEVTSISGQVPFTATSDGRFKENLKEDVAGLDFIMQLRPVSYTFNKAKLKKHLNPNGVTENINSHAEVIRETGFIAQEVESIVEESGYVFSGVDKAENENDIYGLRYGAFVVPLVSAVQELNEQSNIQNEMIDELTILVQQQQAQINDLLNAIKNNSLSADQVSVDSENVLFQIYPNPFTEVATIEMEIASTVKDARIIISNLEGKEINSISVSERGKTVIQILGSALESGIYLCTLVTDGVIVDTKRMILTK